MRVFLPPLPFVSGHALFTSYSVLTAAHRPLRAIAFVVLLHVVYTKLFVSGGSLSMLAGFATAGILWRVRQSGESRQ
jgi:hypothetical protein